MISVGATTDDGCLADFSNDGVGLDIVAPGGGDDADLPHDPNCQPGHHGRDIYQMTYAELGRAASGCRPATTAPRWRRRTSSATAALVIASGVLGARADARARSSAA